MRALRLTEWGTPAVLAEVAQPVPEGAEVLVRVEAAGVCRSDLHVLDAPVGALPFSPPFTLGHEVAGHVAACGLEAAGLQPGERVAVYGPWGFATMHDCDDSAEKYSVW